MFLATRGEWLTMLAAYLRGFTWAGIKMHISRRVKMAIIASISPFHVSMQFAEDLQSSWMPTLYLAASEKVSSMVERLNAWQPEMLGGGTSMLRILAEEQLAGRLQIAPCTVISGGEVLTPETRRRIVQTWGDVLFDLYTTTEGVLDAAMPHLPDLHVGRPEPFEQTSRDLSGWFLASAGHLYPLQPPWSRGLIEKGEGVLREKQRLKI